jgi:hypothetical protein
MTLNRDVFFRSHVVELKPKEKATNDYNEPKWPEYAIVFDTETTLDPKEQALIFGWYRVLHLEDGMYVCVEEGIFHADHLDEAQLDIIKSYVRLPHHQSEVTNCDYDEHIKVYSRSEFVEKVFFAAVKIRALICVFNAPFDISRLAVDYTPSRDRAWSFVLSQREFDVEKLRKNWLTRKWKTTKNGNLSTRCGNYTVTITQNEFGFSSIDEAKLDAFRALSERVALDKQAGAVLEANPERPRIVVTAKDSKAAFFRLTKPLHPEEWPCYETWRKGGEKHFCQCGETATHRTTVVLSVDGPNSSTTFLCTEHAQEAKERGQRVACIKKPNLIFRVLDLRTLGWALFNESYSLKSACEALQTEHKKLDHEPTGMVSDEELDYGRQDVRCTADVLNKLKEEFDLHPFEPDHQIVLYPDKAVSPASLGKAYLGAMGIVPPMEKFSDVPDYIHGIAAQAFSAGRAEIRIRHTAVPVSHCDLTSQYPTVNSLLGNPEVLAAERLSFEDVTEEIRALAERITPEDCFNREQWRKFKVFVRVKPDRDLFPVRAEYNDDGITKNIGMNYLTSDKPLWFTLCDVIASKLLNNGKVPHIEKAIRMCHTASRKDSKVKLRGEVEVDPRKDDLFQVMIEQKELYKQSAKQKKLRGDITGAESDKALSYFLKICANATSYGMYFELTPQKLFKPVNVKVFSGEHNEELTVSSVERPGTFYFPPIAALITGGAHLMLALIQRCVEDKGGHYLFCDTDSMCIVASEKGGWVRCPGERGPNGEYGIKALSWKDVDDIAKRFESLNPYDRKKVPGSILKIEDVNFHNGKRIELYAYAISAKRYVMYRHDAQGNLVIVDAKAHGLGYLYSPRESDKDDPGDDWIKEAWHGILEGEVATPRPTPDCYKIPAMMRIAVTTPSVLGMLKNATRPNNFVFMPLPFPTYDRSGTKREANFNLIMPFSKQREDWASAKATDTRTGKQYRIHPGVDRDGRKKRGEIWVKTYGNILGEYREHPEAKFLGPDGLPCTSITRGLLRPSHIIASSLHYIGKETSRHWEQGDDRSLEDFRCMEYQNGKVIANKETRERIKKFGVRKIERGTGIHNTTITLITRGAAVKPITLSEVIKFLDKQEPKDKPFSADTLQDLPDLKELRDALDPKKDKNHIALLSKRIKRLESLKEQSALAEDG